MGESDRKCSRVGTIGSVTSLDFGQSSTHDLVGQFDRIDKTNFSLLFSIQIEIFISRKCLSSVFAKVKIKGPWLPNFVYQMTGHIV